MVIFGVYDVIRGPQKYKFLQKSTQGDFLWTILKFKPHFDHFFDFSHFSYYDVINGPNDVILPGFPLAYTPSWIGGVTGFPKI